MASKMRLMKLRRVAWHRNGPTFGVLIDTNYPPFALTLEPPWKGNRVNESCIPIGSYICKHMRSRRHGETFEVTDVRDRSGILFHKGNVGDDTLGCIVVGEQFEELDGKPAVLASRKGFDEFMRRLKGYDRFVLKIRYC